MKNMEKNFKQGTVWIARIAFKGSIETKIRPVVIVNNELALDIDVIINPISSAEPRNQFDVTIEYWKEAGLEKPSIVRTSKITTITGKELIRQIGELHPHDLRRVLEMCRKLF